MNYKTMLHFDTKLTNVDRIISVKLHQCYVNVKHIFMLLLHVQLFNSLLYYPHVCQSYMCGVSVTHGCIIATVTLFHPDGREAKPV